MKAMIFAAGLGTRLKPFTEHCPKALVPYHGTPLLERLILHLRNNGFDEMVVNVHHFPDMIIDFLDAHNHFGVKIHISDERDCLLDTGGGLMKAAPYLQGDEPFLVHNVDVVSDIDLRALLDAHEQTGAVATLAVRNRTTHRKLLFDRDGWLQGWKNDKTGDRILIHDEVSVEELEPLAFSGIQVISPDFFDIVTLTGKFSMIDAYLDVAKYVPVAAYQHDQDTWMDVGKPEALVL